MRQVPKKSLYPLFLISFFDTVAYTIGFPVLTFLCFDERSSLFLPITSHALRSFWYGIFSASPSLIAILTAPLLGFISDYFGRKKVLILGACGMFLLCVLAAFSILFGVIALFLVGCLVAGFCARTEPVALAVVADFSDPKRKLVNMGYLQLSISIGAFLGPLLGGFFADRFWFAQFNFTIPYFVGAVIGFLALVLSIVYFKESFIPKHYVDTKFHWRVFLRKDIINISLVLILTQISWRIYYQFMPPFLKVNFHYSPTVTGLFMGLIAVWLALATAFGIKFLNRFFTIKSIIYYCCIAEFIGLIIALIGSSLVSTFWATILIWVSAIPVAMSDVIIFSALTTLYSEATHIEHQGKIMGLCFIIVSLVWAGTSLIGGFLAGVNIILPILFAPVSLIALLLCLPKFLPGQSYF